MDPFHSLGIHSYELLQMLNSGDTDLYVSCATQVIEHHLEKNVHDIFPEIGRVKYILCRADLSLDPDVCLQTKDKGLDETH